MTIQHRGKKESWGSIPPNVSYWQTAEDGSVVLGDGKTFLAIDFSGASGASGASGMLVMVCSYGGARSSCGGKVIVGHQTVSIEEGKLVLGQFADLKRQ